MKSLYILLFLSFTFSHAQIVNIPDPNLKNVLLNRVDTNFDGEVQQSEAEMLQVLDARSENISSIVGLEAFINLEEIDCAGNNISDLSPISGLTNLRELDCRVNNISSLDFINNLTNLEVLICNTNNLNNLDVSALSNLRELRCNINNIGSLDVSGLSNLELLYCDDNAITNLNIQGASSLRTIWARENQLSEIDVNGFTNLIALNVSLNNLTSLDVSTNLNLYNLICSFNQITTLTLGNLPNLDAIHASSNEISSYDFSQTPNLRLLYSNDNKLTNLDLSNLAEIKTVELNNNLLTSLLIANTPKLGTLKCVNNALTELDDETSNISTLYIDDNELVNLKTSASILHVRDNDLVYLDIKNGKIITNGTVVLKISGNPLEHVCIDDLEYDSVRFTLDVAGLSDTVVNSYCSFVPGGDNYVINGNNRYDLANDGCENDDSFNPFLKYNVSSSQGDGTVYSNSSGDYSVPVNAGTYTLTPVLENETYFSVIPENIEVNFPSDASPFIQDFCITPNGSFNDLEILFFPVDIARPGFVGDYRLVFKNKGTNTLSGDIQLNFDDNVMDFTQSNPSVTTQSTGSLTWSYNNLLPFETRYISLSFSLNTPTHPNFPLNSGDVLVFDGSINPINTDETPEDNIFKLDQTVVNSQDPNNKTCLENESITEDMVGEFVHYIIRFENLGTANATNVVVKDIIDTAKFDISSLFPIDASHEFVTRIRENNIVEFIFENIDLPFDDANNDGYVVFKIKTLPTLEVGDAFSNDAEIYFDFNFPITTNDYLTTIDNNLGLDNARLDNLVMYPNPVADLIFLKTQYSIIGISIYDINGRLLSQLVPTGNSNQRQVDVGKLPQGIYFIKVTTEIGEQVSKIVKE